MGRKIHVVVDVDEEQRSGTCSFCGPVKIKWKKTYWACMKSQMRWTSSRVITLKLLGMTHAEFLGKVLEVEGKCRICKKEFGDALVIDHDHKSGKFRGMLCSHCNLGIGFLKDNPEYLRSGAVYLEDF